MTFKSYINDYYLYSNTVYTDLMLSINTFFDKFLRIYKLIITSYSLM